MIKKFLKNNLLYKSLPYVAFAIVVFGSFYLNRVNNHSFSVVVMEAQYPADFSDDRVLVGASHNIFIGKVIRQIETKELGLGPETQFEVQIVDNIKGELKGNVIVDQQGGYKEGVLYVIVDDVSANKGDSYLLVPGETYLLATRYNEKENWHTLNSYPTAKTLILGINPKMNEKQLQILFSLNSRIKALKEAYPKEVTIDADIRNNNTLNSYKSSLQRE